MNIAQPSLQQPRYLAGIGVSLAVHLLLVALWQASRPIADVDEAPREMELMRVRIVPEAVVGIPLPLPVPASRRRQAAPSVPQATTTAETPPSPVPPADPVEQVPAPPSPAADLLARARASVGGIDRTLRQENPRRGIQVPIVTPAMKLERGIARAAELAPNRWYEAPKTEEILDPGGYGRRRYRVTTALGTYCVTYESNHAPDGRDSMRDGIPPKRTNCDGDEQPATIQKWN
ncbi:hypothetical protein [Massilia sp. SYSU DXS3249]